MGQKRVFVAIPISEKLQNTIAAWHGAIEHPGVRWVAREDLHVRLLPPWEEEEGTLNNLLGRLQGVANGLRPLPFTMRFSSVTIIPTVRFSTPLYSKEENRPHALFRLVELIERALADRVTRGPYAPFMPHMTIADSNSESAIMDEEGRVPNLPVDWHEHVESFVLMELCETEGGPRYKILETFSLV